MRLRVHPQRDCHADVGVGVPQVISIKFEFNG
jgi:hypothetical protein